MIMVRQKPMSGTAFLRRIDCSDTCTTVDNRPARPNARIIGTRLRRPRKRRTTRMDTLEARTMAKVSRRLLPYAVIGYFIADLDRVNLSFAALEMNKDLGFS